MTITSVLSLFTLLTLSSLLFFLAKRIKVPYTVFLVLVGLILVPLSHIFPALNFLFDLQLTPELLFFVFLPILIFESAFRMNIRRLVENIWSISLLSIFGLIISAIIIAGGLYFVLPLVGIEIPFILALLFGSIISSTDPVAGLALFKESGAPKRLTLIFEGESLFNDGPAVALFLIILGIAQFGFHGSTTLVEGVTMFIVMIVGGLLLGLIVAFLFSRILRHTRKNEFAAVTILIVSAHITFILGEWISTHGLFGFHFHVSAIMATVVSSLFLGNYSRHILSPRSDEYLEKSIEHLAFVANSLVFILIGILFASSAIPFSLLWLPILVTVLIVAIARALSVYAVFIPLNAAKVEEQVPSPWLRLLSWGSIRGALVVIMILLIPDTYSPTGWEYVFSPRELLLSLAIGCILATLFIKALTIKPLLKKMNIKEDSLIEKVYMLDLEVYELLTEDYRFSEQQKKGFHEDEYYEKIKQDIDARLQHKLSLRSDLYDEYGADVFKESLHLAAINIENKYLRDLYINEEIGEKEYRHLLGKLSIQKEKIETNHYEDINPSTFWDGKDVFERMVMFFQKLQGGTSELSDEEKVKYYRAQSIISRKVIKTLEKMQTQYGHPVFIEEIFSKIVHIYEQYRDQSKTKMEEIVREKSSHLHSLLEFLSHRSLEAAKHKSLSYLSEKGFIKEE